MGFTWAVLSWVPVEEGSGRQLREFFGWLTAELAGVLRPEAAGVRLGVGPGWAAKRQAAKDLIAAHPDLHLLFLVNRGQRSHSPQAQTLVRQGPADSPHSALSAHRPGASGDGPAQGPPKPHWLDELQREHPELVFQGLLIHNCLSRFQYAARTNQTPAHSILLNLAAQITVKVRERSKRRQAKLQRLRDAAAAHEAAKGRGTMVSLGKSPGRARPGPPSPHSLALPHVPLPKLTLSPAPGPSSATRHAPQDLVNDFRQALVDIRI